MSRITGLLASAMLLTSCGFETCRPSFEPLPALPLGLMLGDRVDGIAVECRGLKPERCRRMAASDLGSVADIEMVDRVVVSCVGRCTDQGGELRMDVVRVNGSAELIANGGYGEFEQSCQ